MFCCSKKLIFHLYILPLNLTILAFKETAAIADRLPSALSCAYHSRATLATTPKNTQATKHNPTYPLPLLQSHQIPQLLDIKFPQPFFTQADNLFGQD